MGEVSVRYIVSDVGTAVRFYTGMLGFTSTCSRPGFARISRGDLQFLLNEPGAGGAAQAMADDRTPAPGGWNRIRIRVDDLAATVEGLKEAGCRFRNEIVMGQRGQQVLLDDTVRQSD